MLQNTGFGNDRVCVCVFYTLCWAVVNVGVTLGGGCQCPCVFAARLNGFKTSETQTCSEKENKNLK